MNARGPGLAMGPAMRCTNALALAAVLAPAAARADDLQVSTEEYAAWPTAVAALQADRHSEGRVVHVVVRDAGSERLPCAGYSLGLDAVARQAFVVGACDPHTGATEVRLARRSALFDHADVVPRPLAAGISATQVRTGAIAGGAASEGGSEVTCTVAVHPYIQDLEHGGRVFLSPDRFILRPLASGVTAAAQSDGWLLRGSAQAGLTIEYDVLDAHRNQVVLHDRATLACGTERLGTAPPAVTSVTAAESLAAHIEPAPAIVVTTRGEGLAGGASEVSGSNPPNGNPGPERPRYTWLFQYGLGAMGIAAMDSMVWLGDGTIRHNGSELQGLGTQVGGGGLFGEFGLSFDINWLYAAVETGWYANSSMWEANVRATLAPAVRLGQVMLYAGPTAFGSYVSATDFYERTYYTGVTVNLAATVGIRYRFEDWSSEHRRFSVVDLFLQGTVPITGSEGFIVAGFGLGQGY